MPASRQQQYHFARPGAMPEPGRLVHGTAAQHFTHAPALRYSSPWPWVLAIGISSVMWVGIGWVIWKLV